MHQGTLEHLAVAGDVVVPTAEQAHHRRSGCDIGFQQTGNCQCAGGLGDDALVLIKVEHRGAHRTLVDSRDRHHVPRRGQGLIRQHTGPLDRGAVDELIDVIESHRSAFGEGGHH